MKIYSLRRLLVSLFVILAALATRAPRAAFAATPPPPAESYHLIKKVVLGGEGFWDYLGIDPANRHLFVSHGTHVMVLNAGTYAVVGDIPDTPGVHGIAIAPDAGRGYISDGRANQVTIFDLKTLKTIGTAKTGEGPDGIIYDPASKRVFTFNGEGNSSTAIDAATGAVVGTFDLGGRPEFAAADGEGHVYNNLEDKSIVLQIDSKSLKILNRWPLAPGESPSGMAIDAAHRRLFIGCHNQMMAIMNADTGKVVATVPIGKGVDANRFDPGTQFAFSSNGDGTLTVVHEDSPDKYTVVDNVQTQRGARTMELDPETHKVFLVTAEFGPMPPAKPGERHFPPIVPGSFTLLVFGR
ncbi:MAG TPA: YncE family protein [Terriglobia bacterium]|nr:YncE family protein [Terriglobia bacterium]